MAVKIDQIQLATNSAPYIDIDNQYSGGILSIKVIRNNTRLALSLSNKSFVFGDYFTKYRADTDIVATCTVFGAGYYSGNCGVGLCLDATSWDYGCGYQYDGSWSSTQQTTIIPGKSKWSGVSAGVHLMSFGWNTINSSTTDRPFNYFNPNASDDSRNRQMVSSIIIYEVLP